MLVAKAGMSQPVNLPVHVKQFLNKLNVTEKTSLLGEREKPRALYVSHPDMQKNKNMAALGKKSRND